MTQALTVTLELLTEKLFLQYDTLQFNTESH